MKNKDLLVICQYNYNMWGDIDWKLFHGKKLLMEGCSSNEDFLKSDAAYWVEDILKTNDCEIEFKKGRLRVNN